MGHSLFGRDELYHRYGIVMFHEQQLAETDTFEQIAREVRAEVEAGVQFALNAPFPEPSEVNQHVYA